jgi:hypothetical protein
LLALAACSGDDKKENTADAGATDAGNGSAAGSGAKGTGSGKEGVECDSHDACGSGLSCLKADPRAPDLKVCARPCTKTSSCKEGERCWSATGEPQEAFCWNTEDEALKACGPSFTALCDETKNLGCLRIEEKGSASGGVCLEPCKLKQDDACKDGFSCLNIIDQDGSGLCVHTVGRGEVCDEPKGVFCEPGNLCLSDTESWRCYQDCSESKKCDDDKNCKELQGNQGSYCE